MEDAARQIRGYQISLFQIFQGGRREDGTYFKERKIDVHGSYFTRIEEPMSHAEKLQIPAIKK